MTAQRMPFRFDPGLSLGHLLTAVPTMVALVWMAAGYAGKTDQNEKQMAQVRQDLTTQISSFKSDVTAQMVSLRADVTAQVAQLQINNDRQVGIIRMDIANIPGMKERVDQLDKRVDQLDSRNDAQSKRMEIMQAVGIQNSADIANVVRTLANQPKTGR